MIDYPERWIETADDSHKDLLRRGVRKRLHALWVSFADTFEPRPWLSGQRMGALDLLACVVSKWSGTRAHLRAARPAWVPVLERIEQHPVVAPVFARHWPSSGT